MLKVGTGQIHDPAAEATPKGNLTVSNCTPRKTAGKYNQPSGLIQNNGKVFTNIKDQMNRWVEDFEEFLNTSILDTSMEKLTWKSALKKP